jgi:ribosomal protein L17
MAVALIKHEQIKTTLPKAKDLRRVGQGSAARRRPPHHARQAR